MEGTQISTEDMVGVANYGGATPEDMDGLEGAGLQPKGKVVQSIIENMEHQSTDGPQKQTTGISN